MSQHGDLAQCRARQAMSLLMSCSLYPCNQDPWDVQLLKYDLAVIGQHFLIVDVFSLEKIIETWGKAIEKSPNADFYREKWIMED